MIDGFFVFGEALVGRGGAGGGFIGGGDADGATGEPGAEIGEAGGFGEGGFGGGAGEETTKPKTGGMEQRGADALWNIYDWLLAPLSIWPIDFEGLAGYVLGRVEGVESRRSSKFKVQGSKLSTRTKIEREGRICWDAESGCFWRLFRRRHRSIRRR